MAEPEFKYDVFISYSSANKDWVRKDLLSALEKAGLKVCIDFRDFKVGKPAIKNMRDGVLESKHTLLVLTEAYLSSGWTDFENMLSQTIDPANREGRIVPLLKEKCKLPLEIGYLTYVNFFDPDDWDIAWKQLFEALGVPGKSESDISTPANSSRDTWHLAHPYPMPPNFTGRAAELKMLDDWLRDDKNRLFILRALGGFGKSALAWQWINTHVNPTEWKKLIWWSFYEGDASFEHFIEETLKYLKLEVPQGQRPQVDELLKVMQSQKILLIMDGFERALRAYSSMNAAYQGDEPKTEENQLDCVNINAEIFLKSICSLPNIKSKALMTTRLSPRAIKLRGEFILGCREEELTSMQPADAVEFFHKQKIKGTHAEIEAACMPYGYHPLSLRLLAGRILKDFENPADIIVAQKLKMDGDIVQQKHHVLEVSYNSLPTHEQKLLSTIACFRSPVELETLEAITENKNSLNDDLHDLVERGLLHFDEKNKKFDLHPIVRRFAYERLNTPQRTDTHVVLVVYFEAIPQPRKIERLEDLAPVIELYHHMVRAGNLDKACDLVYDRIADTIYFQFGAYQIEIELLSALFIDGEDKPPRLKDEKDQAWTLNELANAYSLSGQPRFAVSLYEKNIAMREKQNDKKNLANGLRNVAYQQIIVGALHAAESNLRRSIDLCREIEHNFGEAVGHQYLGFLLTCQGTWHSSNREQLIAMEMFENQKLVQSQSYSITFQSICDLSICRDPAESPVENRRLAIAHAQRALELAEETVRTQNPFPRDFVRAHWLLGASYRLGGQLNLAEHHLNEALTRDRAINLVAEEANILLDLARLRYDQQNYAEAKSLADEALLITERCGYVLQGADVNLFLAQYALEQEKDKAKAKQYAEEAKKLAHCDDGPPYYYKVAYEEAERFLKKL